METNVNISLVDEIASPILINTLLQRGALNAEVTQNRFNGFDKMWKTAEAVMTDSPRSHTPLKQGVNETNPMKTWNFVNHSETRKVVHA